MKIRPFQPGDVPEWRRLRQAFYFDYSPEQIDLEIAEFQSTGRMDAEPVAMFVAERAPGRLAGFIEAGLRIFADGCRTSPVGYLESLYVEEDARRQGIARSLVSAAENWAREQGCTEMASDCDAVNNLSHAVHLGLGYQPAIRQVPFRRPLHDASACETTDWIALVPNWVDPLAVIKLVADAGAGGVDVFLGTTRAETNDRGQQLVALDYEAYPEMAIRQMHELVARARARWPIVKLAIAHRTGRVELAEPSVVIAVSCPHRAEAFEACRWLIDTLKAEVAIWKKEIWSDGSDTWVHTASK